MGGPDGAAAEGSSPSPRGRQVVAVTLVALVSLLLLDTLRPKPTPAPPPPAAAAIDDAAVPPSPRRRTAVPLPHTDGAAGRSDEGDRRASDLAPQSAAATADAAGAPTSTTAVVNNNNDVGAAPTATSDDGAAASSGGGERAGRVGLWPLSLRVQAVRGCLDVVTAASASGARCGTGKGPPPEAYARFTAYPDWFDAHLVDRIAGDAPPAPQPSGDGGRLAPCLTAHGVAALLPVKTRRDLALPPRLHPPPGRRAFHHALWCVGVANNGHTSKYHNTGTWEKRIEGVEKAGIHPIRAAMHGGVSPHRNVRQALHMGWLLGIVSPAAFALLGGSPPHRLLAATGLDKLLAAHTDHPFRFYEQTLSTPSSPAVATTSGNCPGAGSPPPPRIIELGAGDAGLLTTLCPPDGHVQCVAFDYAPAVIRRGRRHAFSSMKLGIGIDAKGTTRPPMGEKALTLGTGTADAVLSHGVMTLLDGQKGCAHIGEALRLLKPANPACGARGGRMVLWMINAGWPELKYHPSFFDRFAAPDGAEPPRMESDATAAGANASSAAAPAPRFLPFCRGLSQLVTAVEAIVIPRKGAAKAPGPDPADAAIYPADFPTSGWFGVVAERSAVPYAAADPAGATVADTLPPLGPLNATELAAWRGLITDAFAETAKKKVGRVWHWTKPDNLQ